MSNKLIVCFVLILAILSPALASSDSGLKVAGFTEFVSNPIVHFAEAAAKPKSPSRLPRPSKNVSRKAYRAGYKTLDDATRSKVSAELKEIRAAVKAAKKAGLHTKKTKAQKGALRKSRKSRISKLLKGLTAKEKKAVRAAAKKINADRKAKRAARKASGAKKPTKKATKKATKKLTKAERKAKFAKLDRPAQLKHIAKRLAKAIRSKRALQRAVLGWKLVKADTRRKLRAKYQAHKHSNPKKQTKPKASKTA